MTGYVYVGFQNKRTKHGICKIGETARTPHIREKQIQRNECYKMVDYITIINTTKSELLAIESAVRLTLDRYKEFTLMGNDHFRYEISDRLTDIEKIREIVIAAAIKACEYYGIEYEYNEKAD